MPIQSALAWRPRPLLRPWVALDALRWAVALLLLLHGLHGLVQAQDRLALATLLAGRHLPAGPLLAWLAFLVQTFASLALLARRWVVPAALAQALVLTLGILWVHAPRWYVVGGASAPGHPGAEYSALLLVCLGALIWVHRRAAPSAASAACALELIRIAAALVVAAHPVHGFFDLAGLPAFGRFLESLGLPWGLATVWVILLTQTLSSLLLVARRWPIPASLAHAGILAMGIWTVHAPDWFVVGPGENGMEFSLLLIVCFLAPVLAAWPRRALLARARA
ncbi:MAG TPA: DoxX family membrane protein [Geothrix sp.]|nr:DoxX family membrane protein [Geothrix sp.]